MSRKSGSFGLVLLVVVMGIVLLLVAKNWQAAAPRLSETMRALPETRRAPEEAGDAPGDATGNDTSPGHALPGVGEMKRATDRHAAQVQEALGEAR